MAEQTDQPRADAWLSTAADTAYLPPALDFEKPQTARMYDYYLGGKDHYTADRETAQRVIDAYPGAPTFARANRNFLYQAVEHLAAEHGITQFMDIGTGIPTSPNVHEVAQHQRPEARVLYTDHDPIVMAHARALMNSTPQGRIDYIDGDLRDPGSILSHACLTGPNPVLDLNRPLAVIMVAVLHFITDEDGPRDLISRFMDAAPPGSYFIASHCTSDFNPEQMGKAVDLYRQKGLPVQLRSREEFLDLLPDGIDVIAPGVTTAHVWHPAGAPPAQARQLYSDADVSCYGLVARKR